MALPKRNSHLLTINDREYRWIASETFNSAEMIHFLRVTVQSASGTGAKLIATDVCESHPTLLIPTATVRPQHVSVLIRHALHKGWDPDQEGGVCLITDMFEILRKQGVAADSLH